MLFIISSIYNPTIVYRRDYNVVCNLFYMQSNNYIEEIIMLFVISSICNPTII